MADGVIRSTHPPLAMAYVGATVRTEWNAAAGPQPQALSWAASGRGPRVCTSSRLHDGAELLVPASPSEPPGWEKAESLDFLARPRCGAKRNFLKDYWDEKPGGGDVSVPVVI